MTHCLKLVRGNPLLFDTSTAYTEQNGLVCHMVLNGIQLLPRSFPLAILSLISTTACKHGWGESVGTKQWTLN